MLIHCFWVLRAGRICPQPVHHSARHKVPERGKRLSPSIIIIICSLFLPYHIQRPGLYNPAGPHSPPPHSPPPCHLWLPSRRLRASGEAPSPGNPAAEPRARAGRCVIPGGCSCQGKQLAILHHIHTAANLRPPARRLCRIRCAGNSQRSPGSQAHPGMLAPSHNLIQFNSIQFND